MKPTVSIISILALLVAAFMPSCSDDDCLDINALDSLKTEMETWYVDTSSNYTDFKDQNNIHQTLVLTNFYYTHFDVVFEDDCGNTYGSWDYSTQYRMSISPLNFMINIRGSGNDADGFYIELSYYRTLGEWIIRTAEYDLETDASRDKDTEIGYLDAVTVDGISYNGVLQITFPEADLPNELEEIYFARTSGIIKFKDKFGNEFIRVNNGQ